MYIQTLSAIIDSHSIIHHSFADDLQLQIYAPPDRISELLLSMQSCISDVKDWATANMLKLNDNKTELMLVTSKRSKHLHNLTSTSSTKSSSITIHLKSLHWLPVKVRSTYKIACLCYHCHSSTAPSYVTGMLHRKPLHTRNTRSSSYTMPLLNRPAHSKATLGDRSFSFASSSVWNSIPNDVRCAPSLSSFKSRLKTYLFRSVYKD